MIRVAVADDSPFTCRLVAAYLERGGDCEVVGVAHDVASTRDLVRRLRPDVLTLDLEMPGGKGLDLLAQLVEEAQLPIVVISGVTRQAAAATLRALELGAVDFVLKYTPGARSRPDALRQEIVTKVKSAATAFPRPLRTRPSAGASCAARRDEAPPAARRVPPRVIVIGASTGGPRAVRDVLAQFPPGFSTPCVVVQHLPPLFTPVFAAELARHVRIPVSEAHAEDRLEPGRALVVPGARHLLVRPSGTLELRLAAESDVHRPSIDISMTTAAESYGSAALGVVLTGMGSDGAEGLHRIRVHGGEGYVQDPASCVMASMPTRALERAGADYVATPERIGHLLAARRAP
jgi:two-component system chemotaxis response regulator CheB